MHVVSHPEADAELEAAALWYEERQSGLGDAFLNEFERTLRRILTDPERWHKIQGNNRKLNFQRFPFAIVYSLGAVGPFTGPRGKNTQQAPPGLWIATEEFFVLRLGINHFKCLTCFCDPNVAQTSRHRLHIRSAVESHGT
jgi:hypothetical protein